MTNRLTKDTKMTYIPGSPGVPYNPGQPYIAPYTTYVQQQVCGWVTTNGSYQWVYNNDTGQYEYMLVPNSSPTSGGWSVATATWVCTNQSVPVYNPGQPYIAPTPGRAYVPAQIMYDYNLGWNSGARSKNAFAGDGYAQFQISPSLVGAVVGLNETDPDADYININHAFYISNGIIRVLEDGVEKAYLGPTAPTDTFRITRYKGTVQYFVDGALLYTSLVPSTGAMFMDVSMYSGGDYIENPALGGLTSGDQTFEFMTVTGGNATAGWASLAFEPLQGSASDGVGHNGTLSFQPLTLSAGKWMAGLTGTYASASMTMRPMTMSTRWAEGMDLSMAPMTVYGGEGTQAEVRMSFLPMTIEARPGHFVPSIAVANLSFSQMTSNGFVLTGQIGQIDMTMEPGTVLAGRAGYGEAVMTMVPPAMYGSAFEGNTNASMRELLVTRQDLQHIGFVDVRFDTGILAEWAIDTILILDAFQFEQLEVTDTLVPSATLNAFMQIDLQMFAGVPVYTEDGEVWVVEDEVKASSRYENYSFNSFGKYKGKYLAARPDGVYLLSGSKDVAEPIRSSISLGTQDFGTSLSKMITDCYIGVASNGDIYLKVTAGGQSYLYKTTDNTTYMDAQRIAIGKGLNASYITFELFNKTGADFELSSIEFRAAALTRRI